MDSQVIRLMARLDASRTEVERLQKDANDWRSALSNAEDVAMKWKSEAEEAKAEIEKLWISKAEMIATNEVRITRQAERAVKAEGDAERQKERGKKILFLAHVFRANYSGLKIDRNKWKDVAEKAIDRELALKAEVSRLRAELADALGVAP